jgi:HK97 family phage major capsid protein
VLNRAYSVFTIKSFDNDARTFEGIATMPTPDREQDVVEPRGAIFRLPISLMWQHGKGFTKDPVGAVTGAQVTDDGILVKGYFAKLDEPPSLKEDLDRAWALVKSKLVRGLSIGFLPIESEAIKGSSGLRFKKWEFLELSPVAIPSHQDAHITLIKSIDEPFLRAALGAKQKSVVQLNSSPGASGQIAANQKQGSVVKTIKERIKEFEASRAAKVAELEAVQQKALDEGRTKDASEKEKFDTLAQEIKAIDAELVDLKEMDALNVLKAAPIDPSVGTDPLQASKARAPALSGIRVETKLEPGVRFARMAMAIARLKSANMGGTPEQFYRADQRWMDTAPEVALALKAAINAGDSTTTGWASELAYAQNIASEFIEFLRPKTLIGRITGWRNVPFNVRVASATSGSTGYWVGQGKPIPMSQLATSSVSLGIAKVAGGVTIDKELARLSTPSAELMVRNDLARECQKVLDLSLIDPNQGGQTNIQPASLTYGVTPRSASGTAYADFKADWKSLTSTMISAQLSIASCVVVMSETTAQALSLMVTSLGNPQFPGLTMTGGTLLGLPVFTTTHANIAGSPQFGETIVLINPGEVFLADDGAATVEASDQVSIQMLDNPTNQSTATSTPTTMVSMWQTESISVKAVRYINWAKARSQACAFIQAAAYV